MFDRLPPFLQHVVLLCVVVPLGVLAWSIASAITAANGITGINWDDALKSAIDTAAVSGGAGVVWLVAAWVSPITRRYGVGAPPGWQTATADPPHREDIMP